MNAKKLLLATADHIERVGWCQGRFFMRNTDGEDDSSEDKDSPCCVRGGMTVAVATVMVPYSDEALLLKKEARELLCSHLSLNGPPDREPVALWNDTQGRTIEEVLAGLRAAGGAE